VARGPELPVGLCNVITHAQSRVTLSSASYPLQEQKQVVGPNAAIGRWHVCWPLAHVTLSKYNVLPYH